MATLEDISELHVVALREEFTSRLDGCPPDTETLNDLSREIGMWNEPVFVATPVTRYINRDYPNASFIQIAGDDAPMNICGRFGGFLTTIRTGVTDNLSFTNGSINYWLHDTGLNTRGYVCPVALTETPIEIASMLKGNLQFEKIAAMLEPAQFDIFKIGNALVRIGLEKPRNALLAEFIFSKIYPFDTFKMVSHDRSLIASNGEHRHLQDMPESGYGFGIGPYHPGVNYHKIRPSDTYAIAEPVGEPPEMAILSGGLYIPVSSITGSERTAR